MKRWLVEVLTKDEWTPESLREVLAREGATRFHLGTLIEVKAPLMWVNGLDRAFNLLLRLAHTEYYGRDQRVVKTIRDAREILTRKGTLSRIVPKEECPWLPVYRSAAEVNVLGWPQGKVVYEWAGPTYGCVSPGGVAVTEEPMTPPFFEVPAGAVAWES